MRYVCLLIAVLFIQLVASAMPLQDSTARKLDRFIENTRSSLGLETGLSIAVVKDGKVIFSKAYGYADVQRGVKAETSTPFYIASSTKSFLAALAKILSDEKVIDLDVPISNYLPGLKLPAPADADFVTMRDLLTHRSGIESLPIILRTAFTGQHTDEKLMELFDSCKFTRRRFRYTNTDYVLAGMIINRVTGSDWRQLIKEKIFDPLGMNSSSCYVSHYSPDTLPVGYATGLGRPKAYNFSKTDETMHAAGGIYASADDLAKWVIFNLGSGEPLLSSYSLDEIHSAQVDYSQKFFVYDRFAYGLGWIRSDYNGKLLIHHFGSYSGARSHISFMPGENIGVTALINDDGDAFYTVDLFADYAYNLLTGNTAADSIAQKELAFIVKSIEQDNDKKKKEQKSEYTGKIDYSLYTGDYSSSDFGEVKVDVKGGELFMEFGNLNGSLVPLSDSLFSSDLGAFQVEVEFTEEGSGGVPERLIIHGPTDIVLTRK